MWLREIIGGVRAGRTAGKAAILYRNIFGVRPDEITSRRMQETASLMYQYDEFQIFFDIVYTDFVYQIQKYEDHSGNIFEIPKVNRLRIALEKIVATGRIHPELRREFSALCSRFSGSEQDE